MKLIWSAWTIVIGVIATPHIHASTTKDDYKGRILLDRENELTGGGSLMRTKKLRNERDLSAQSRVVGGQDADIGKYPFFVEWDGCGASLVHKDIIVSAAHCAEISSDIVYVGSSRKFALDFAGGRGLERLITTRIRHPSYNSDKIDFDYLVMKLNTPVEDIKPALLNEDTAIPTDAELLTVIGYGRTTDGGEGTSTLQEVGVNYIPPAECSNYYSGLINGDTMICAATGETKGSCQGDSGGPLVIQDGDTYTQVGIVSWGGARCASPDFPGVYSRVSGQIDWIKTQICTLSDFPPDYCNGGSIGPVAVTAGPISSPPITGGISAAPVFPTSVSPPTAPTSPTAPVSPPTVPTSPISAPISPPAVPTAPTFPTVTVAPPSTLPTSPTAPAVTPTVPTFPTVTVSPPTVPTSPVAPPVVSPTVASSSPLPIPAPTTSQECTDSDATFAVDDVLQNQDCTWLADNQSMFGYLCRFLDIAAACKKTCNACQYFFP